RVPPGRLPQVSGELALELEELVVAAARALRKLAADARAGLVDRALALRLVEEHARRVEDAVALVAQERRALRAHLGVAALGDLEVDAEVAREALDVALRDLDVGVRAAVGRTLVARVVHRLRAHRDGK